MELYFSDVYLLNKHDRGHWHIKDQDKMNILIQTEVDAQRSRPSSIQKVHLMCSDPRPTMVQPQLSRTSSNQRLRHSGLDPQPGSRPKCPSIHPTSSLDSHVKTFIQPEIQIVPTGSPACTSHLHYFTFTDCYSLSLINTKVQ